MTEQQIETNRRKRFVRRCYKKSPLWVVELTQERYPDYNASLLFDDLRIKYKRKRKHEKQERPKFDFRTCQILKYIELMNCSNLDSKDYHRACIMISRMNEAHIKRKDIFLTIFINKETIRYGFKWSSTERYIKAVAELPKQCATHKEFEQKMDDLYNELHSFGR